MPVQNMTYGMVFNQEAKELGFQDGDILLRADGKDFKTYDADLFRTISKAKEVVVKRNGQEVAIALPGDLNLLNMIKEEPRFASPLIPFNIDSIMPGSPADKAGIRPGDVIVNINGHEVANYNEFINEIGRLKDMMTAAQTPADSMKIRSAQIVLAHNNATDTVNVVLTPELTLGFTNLNKYTPVTTEYGFFESFPAGIRYGWNVLSGYVSDLKYVFSSDGVKSLGGFGTIGNLFPSMWDWHRFWEMTAFLSIILAFMNILPIPALDGGHVLFLIYEMITRRKPSEEFMIRAEYVGFGIVILLMVVANLNDILRSLGIM